MIKKPILCLDFDGVIHSYASGWKGATIIPDAPVPGAMDFIVHAVRKFDVNIYSSRSGQPGGIDAMKSYMSMHLYILLKEKENWVIDAIAAQIEWPTEKPPAMVSIDDRALTFTGVWPKIEDLLAFQPWNRVHDKVTLARCPFCNSKNIDPKGWAGSDQFGVKENGPACDDCGGTAATIELWNRSVKL